MYTPKLLCLKIGHYVSKNDDVSWCRLSLSTDEWLKSSYNPRVLMEDLENVYEAVSVIFLIGHVITSRMVHVIT